MCIKCNKRIFIAKLHPNSYPIALIHVLQNVFKCGGGPDSSVIVLTVI